MSTKTILTVSLAGLALLGFILILTDSMAAFAVYAILWVMVMGCFVRDVIDRRRR
jgi:hypothetical protein